MTFPSLPDNVNRPTWGHGGAPEHGSQHFQSPLIQGASFAAMHKARRMPGRRAAPPLHCTAYWKPCCSQRWAPGFLHCYCCGNQSQSEAACPCTITCTRLRPNQGVLYKGTLDQSTSAPCLLPLVPAAAAAPTAQLWCHTTLVCMHAAVAPSRGTAL